MHELAIAFLFAVVVTIIVAIKYISSSTIKKKEHIDLLKDWYKENYSKDTKKDFECKLECAFPDFHKWVKAKNENNARKSADILTNSKKILCVAIIITTMLLLMRFDK
ncbi:MAG: hypothetical protein ACL93V_03175 [Candidatus Electrothrix sp. YB6]